MSDRPSFFAELKRRNVYKVAVAYAIVAWLLIQIATQVFPFFEVPNWGVRLVVLLIAIGFPIALILAWAFELTPEGIKRSDAVPPNESIAHHTGRKLTVLTVIVAVIAAAFLVLPLMRHKSVVATGNPAAASSVPKATLETIPEKSIAVLPFENRSEEKANAYFADSIQDEILTRLSKIADLKVISRTSTQHYRSAPENLREIARQLGVAHIVEGSVQKSGEIVRVNVQLIKAANDSHLWADTFDRKMTDILSVESEVAKAIADQLRVKLTGHEEQIIAAKPTDNLEAYDAYLRGLAYSLKAQTTQATSLGAQKYLREAVRLDPKFALSWALLSYVDAVGYITQSLQPTIALREEAREAAETALTLQPNLGEALMA
jgi:TolB-like protein